MDREKYLARHTRYNRSLKGVKRSLRYDENRCDRGVGLERQVYALTLEYGWEKVEPVARRLFALEDDFRAKQAADREAFFGARAA